jgi:hypothetical protein
LYGIWNTTQCKSNQQYLFGGWPLLLLHLHVSEILHNIKTDICISNDECSPFVAFCSNPSPWTALFRPVTCIAYAESEDENEFASPVDVAADMGHLGFEDNGSGGGSGGGVGDDDEFAGFG